MISFLQTIGFRLWLVAAFVITLPLIINIGIMEYGQYTSLLGLSRNHLKKDGLFKTSLLKEVPPLNRSVVDFLITALDLSDHFPQTPDMRLSQKLRTFFKDGFEEITLILPISKTEKLVVASSETLNEGLNYFPKISIPSDIPLLISLKKSESFPNKLLLITEANIYNNETGMPQGILYATHDASSLLNPILKHSSSVKTLLFSNNDLITFSDNTSVDIPLLQKIFLPILKDHSYNNKNFNFRIKKEKAVGYLIEIPELNLKLINYQNNDDIFINFKKTFYIAIISLILLIPALMLAFIITKRLSLPMIRLAKVMSSTGKNFSKITEYQKDRFGFEINHLGEIFNGMVKTLLLKRNEAAITEKEKNEGLTELELGREAQKTLLSGEYTHFSNLEVSKVYIPALSVGGDFYDLFMNKEEKDLFIIIADASDKGVSACCYSLELKMILETLLQETHSIETAITKTAHLFHKDTKESGMFVTAFVGKYNYERGVLSYYSCGHVPGVILRNNQEILLLNHPGMALGFIDKPAASQCYETIMGKGDKLILYSDGITESCDSDYKLFGEERLIETIQQTHNMSAKQTSDYIIDRIRTFVGQQQQHDDITLIVIEVKG